MSAEENSHRGQAPKEYASAQSWQNPSPQCHQEDRTGSLIECKPDHPEGANTAQSCQKAKR